MSFIKATREKTKLKMCLAGPPGSGKSYSALRFAFAMLAAGFVKKIAVIESEAGKIKKYAGYVVDGVKWDFDVLVLTNFSPADYVSALELAAASGYDLVIIDGISHEWQGKGGALEMVDRLEDKNKFAGWKTVTPMHNTFIDTVLRLPVHVIATCRSKMDYVLEDVTTKDGRTVKQPRKVGMGAIQRSGVEYEFEIFCELDQSHILHVTKTICPLIDGKVVAEPGPDFIAPIIKWLDEGVEVTASGSFKSSLVSPAAAGELVESLISGGVDITKEKDFILSKFGATEWTHLTPAQFTQYRERAAYLIGQAQQLAKQINEATSNRQTLQEAGDAALPPQQPAQPSTMDAATERPTPPNDGQGHEVPVSPTAPAEYVRPSILGPDVDGGILAAWSELSHLLSFTSKQSMEVLEATCVSMGGVKDVRQLSPEKKTELEKNLVGKIIATYRERNMEAAARPYLTA